MATSREQALTELRRSIDVLPERTRKAMLIGLSGNTVITGAFTGDGGVCPMMAAHREGGRTSCVSFPEAWDRFTGVAGRQIVRPATAYEVATLRAQIEESLKPSPTASSSMLAEAIAEHQATVEARRRRSRYTGPAVDLVAAIDEHMATARSRRSREADQVGLDWLFEDALVLPDDFGSEKAAERPAQPEFDFDEAESDLAHG